MQIKTFKIQDLIEYARNPRKNDDVVDKMLSCIKEFGFKIPIVAKSDGSVVDGHLRLKAARKLDMKEVPVVIADDLTEAQIKAFRLVANQSTNWAEWNEELLKLEFEDLKNLNFDLELTGFDLEEIESFLNKDLEIEEDDFEDDDILNEELPVISKLGDLWILGDHRLLCGDSTQPEAFHRLLGSEKANMTFTDPPYNVDYGNNPRDTIRENQRHILNDKLEDFSSFLKKICSNINEYTNGTTYICMSSTEMGNLKNAYSDTGGHFSTFIIWVKNHFSVGKSDYQRQYETILYGWTAGASHYWCGDRSQSDIWSFDRVSFNDLHPTMKPIPLVAKAVVNSSKIGDIILDPFGGSGTTLIACDETDRKCFMIELDPKYVDTIIRRWQKHTGKSAILESTGKSFDEVEACR